MFQEDPDQFRVLSLGQFRPEKDHPLQVRALARLRDKITEEVGVSQEERETRWKRVRDIFIYSSFHYFFWLL